jgi:hypothetical protein
MVYALGVFTMFSFLFPSDRVTAAAILMALGTMGDIRVSHGPE